MVTVSSNGLGRAFITGVAAEPVDDRPSDWAGVVVGCPALGLAGDRASYYLVPCAEHVCYAEGDSRPAPTEFQETFCLSGRHSGCPVWQGKERLDGNSGVRSRVRLHAPSLPAGLPLRLAAGVAVLGIAVAGGIFAWRSHAGAMRGHATAHPSAVGSVQAAAVQPAAPPDLAPTLRAIGHTITAALTRPLFQPYTVRPGDSLTGVAARFNTTVDALAQLNKLSPKAGLTIGQQLVVPVAPGH